ncbi:DUF669 domain-containing protein [Pullulanibacillus sp. KACC 23026]|uniref:DUF669 domain-containing protein n=1 Tax=Pullulanibacillus sp. KACC 23026 TaxID=3028315 RepID=UPI0023B17DF9|nr:DUF669 domain-containing protein [Pullulanibacillus sp. KACC 23026]WEG13978.1 DUF669 domain-containing protein [Pullulanibacillus sp. KACC 23026]
MFKVDHEQAKGFEPIKPGEYEVTVVNYELKKAASGNNQVVMDYEIRSDFEQPCQGQKILFDNFTVTEKAMWRFHAASKAAGMPNGKQYKSYKEWAEAMLNQPLRLVVGEREHNGKKYPQVNGFKLSEAPLPDVPTVDDSEVPF